MTAPGLFVLEADNPANLTPRLDNRPDPKVTYALDGVPFGEVDEDGCWWIVQKTSGWHEPVKRRTARSDRAHADGSYRGRARKAERAITLTGTCLAPHIGARLAAQDRLADCCGEDGQLHELRVTDQLGRVRTADVELENVDAPTQNETRFNFQINLVAPDPRKHGPWQDPIAPLPGLRSGALSWPLAFPLDFGQPPPTGGVARVANHGTAWAYPVFELLGPMPRPSIVDDIHGWTLDYLADIAAGERVVINCDDFRAKGFRGHAVWSSERGSVRSLLKVGTDWPAVEPRSSASFRAETASEPPAQIMTSLRSAYR